MAAASTPPRPLRFGTFEVNPSARELRKDGVKLHLQEQPLHVLMALLERPGEIVTRDELRLRLWPDGSFVEFDDGLNAAMTRLRQALSDSAENPRFIQTVPRHGYRFIAPVTPADSEPASADGETRAVTSVTSQRTKRPVVVLGLLVATLVAGGYAVQQWLSYGATENRMMLAVMRLQHLGGGSDAEALADGLTVEITTALARLNARRLGVIARTSVARYDAQTTSISDVGRDLNVEYVLQGTVRQTNGRVRITAQLIEVDGESHLWAQSYDRELADIFAVQSDIAERVARQLAVQLLHESGRPRDPPLPEAHVAYLRGLHFWNKRNEPGLRRAIELYREAIDLDPGYARAHAGLASAYASLATSAGAIPAAQARALAEAAARRALALHPELAEGHAVLSAIACRLDWDWTVCEGGLKRALALDPSYATGHHLLGEYLLQRGRFEEAIAELRQARTLDPLSPAIHTHLGLAYMYARQYDEALPYYAQASEIDPNYLLAHRTRGLTLVRSGRVDEGLAALRQARALDPRSPRAIADLGYALAHTGRTAEARQMLKELAAMEGEQRVSPYDFAVVHAALGDNSAALTSLQQAYADRATGVRWLKIEPIFDGLRGEIRFKELLQQLGMPN